MPPSCVRFDIGLSDDRVADTVPHIHVVFPQPAGEVERETTNFILAAFDQKGNDKTTPTLSITNSTGLVFLNRANRALFRTKYEANGKPCRGPFRKQNSCSHALDN